jgi:MSHA biogenesis protein MshL
MKQRILWPIALATILGWPVASRLPCAAAEAALEGQTADIVVTAAQSLGGTKFTLVTNGWADVREILSPLAHDAKLGLQIAPDVEGQVNVHLEDVSLEAALAAILEPIELGYEIVGGALIVYKRGMVTRWMTFDYPVTEREGRGELLVSARSGGQQSGGGSSAGGQESGGQQNESHVTSTSTMKVWPQVIGALQTLIFTSGEAVGASGSSAGEEAMVSLADAQGRSLVVNPMAGIVQVTAEWSRVKRAEGLLKRLEESLRRQVAIEVKVLEVTLNDEERTGIDWSNASGKHVDVDLSTTEGLTPPVLTFVLKNTKTTGLMELLSEQGTVRVLSTPRITTLNNQKAVVRIVTEEVFFEAQVEPQVILQGGIITPAVVEYTPRIIPVGLVLDVTPQIGKDRLVTLNVHPTISNIVRVETSPNQDTQPVVNVRELDTVGKVGDGETLVIAGLISEGFRETVAGVPILKQIPLLKYLFSRTLRQQTRTELVMLLTPIILDGERASDMAAEAEALIRKKM